MLWPKKKKIDIKEPIKKSNQDIKVEKIYLENTLDANRTAVALLLTDYFYYLPVEDRIKVQAILFSISPRDYQGWSIMEACHTLNSNELLEIQKLVEKDYKVVRH